MTDGKVGTYRFVVEPFHTDSTERLTLSVLGNHLLDCAGFHAGERGFGMNALRSHRCTWVLSRLVMELEDLPRRGEEFVIRTWVENVYRLFTDRNFALLSKEGNPFGYARSVWAMIDMETRKPADVLALYGDGIVAYMCDEECPIRKPGRIKSPAGAVPMSYRVRPSDIDVNGHVNSVKYIEHILDLFSSEAFGEKRIQRFEVAYVAESRYGDTLDFYLGATGENEYSVEVRKNNAEAVVRSKVIFI